MINHQCFGNQLVQLTIQVRDGRVIEGSFTGCQLQTLRWCVMAF